MLLLLRRVRAIWRSGGRPESDTVGMPSLSSPLEAEENLSWVGRAATGLEVDDAL